MWQVITRTLLAASLTSVMSKSNERVFRSDQIIFSSTFNITKILVPADGNRYVQTESSEMPSIFFTVSDSTLDGGTCIYVLEGYAAYEILEGGRDSTAEYSVDRTVYFGAKDGIYKYDHESLSAKKLGPFRDSIIQIQKANGTDKIYILTDDGKLYVLESNGTVRTKVKNVVCAIEFVLDTSNNIYFVQCGDKMIHIIREDGMPADITASVIEDFEKIKLLRPAFVMEKCIPFFGDGKLYILHANGTSEPNDFHIEETPSAFSIDATLYLVAALDGKIYELNVMDVLLQSMLGVKSGSSRLTKMIMSVLENVKDGIIGLYNS